MLFLLLNLRAAWLIVWSGNGNIGQGEAIDNEKSFSKVILVVKMRDVQNICSCYQLGKNTKI